MNPESNVACAACGSDDLSDDYDGDLRVTVCNRCGWPPPFPASVDNWRALYKSLGREPTTQELRDAVEAGRL